MGSKISIGGTRSLRSSLNVTNHPSHPYCTTGNIIVLYILIFLVYHWYPCTWYSGHTCNNLLEKCWVSGNFRNWMSQLPASLKLRHDLALIQVALTWQLTQRVEALLFKSVQHYFGKIWWISMRRSWTLIRIREFVPPLNSVSGSPVVSSALVGFSLQGKWRSALDSEFSHETPDSCRSPGSLLSTYQALIVYFILLWGGEGARRKVAKQWYHCLVCVFLHNPSRRLICFPLSPGFSDRSLRNMIHSGDHLYN